MTDYRAMVAERGLVVLYRQHERNICPGCGGSQWHVGRSSAQCAFCDTAIPLVAPVAPPSPQEG